MGRKRADVWNEYEELDKEDSFKARRVKCTHCGREFTAHANRMKDHLKECSAYREVGSYMKWHYLQALHRGTAQHVDLSSTKYDTTKSNDFPQFLSSNVGDVISLLKTYNYQISTKNILRMGIVGGSPGSTMAPLHINAGMNETCI